MASLAPAEAATELRRGTFVATAAGTLQLADADASEGLTKVAGDATFFDKPDVFGRVIRSGAFDESLQQSGGFVPILMNHEDNAQIGWGLSAKQQGKVLKVEGVLVNDLAGRVLRLMQVAADNGRAFGISIGWRGSFTIDQESDEVIWEKADLVEWSVTPFPAWEGTVLVQAAAEKAEAAAAAGNDFEAGSAQEDEEGYMLELIKGALQDAYLSGWRPSRVCYEGRRTW